jgi:hypothetical protein
MLPSASLATCVTSPSEPMGGNSLTGATSCDLRIGTSQNDSIYSILTGVSFTKLEYCHLPKALGTNLLFRGNLTSTRRCWQVRLFL